MKTLLRVASSSNVENPRLLDELLATESWQTLMTFAQELARESMLFSRLRLANLGCRPAARPSAVPAITQPSGTMDEDIPTHLYNQFDDGDVPRGGGIKICPHCTYENTHGGTDCDVCGLPL